MKSFAELLVLWRAAHHLTQTAAVQLIEQNLGETISLRTYERWERGEFIPHGITRVAIERMIGDE